MKWIISRLTRKLWPIRIRENISPGGTNQISEIAVQKAVFHMVIIIMIIAGFRSLKTRNFVKQWTIPLNEAASLLWDFYRDALRSVTLLSFNVLSQKS